MTPDGRFIAFVANTNGITGTNTCINLWDAQNGANTLVSVDLANQVPAGTCDGPTIDPTGRYVAFLSTATNLVSNSLSGEYHLYVRDMQGGATKIVGTDTNDVGSPMSPATVPSLSADGSLVAFESFDASLVANDRNRAYDVFVQDILADPAELTSAHAAGLPSMTPNGPSTVSISSVSANGRFIAFAGEGDNLVANDTNGCRDVFVRDRQLGTNILVSISTNGVPGDSFSTDSSISADGRYVVFTSSADDLVAGDTNKFQDVFLRDLQTATTTLVSVNMNGTGSGNNFSVSPTLGSDGKYVLFTSRANNLAPGSSATVANLLLRNLQSGTTYFLGSSVTTSTLTPDGRFVAFGTNTYPNTTLYVWDSQVGAWIYTNALGSAALSGLALRADGSWLAYATASQLVAVNLATRGGFTVASLTFGPRLNLQFSADGRFLTYSAKPTSTGSNQVYLFDFQTQNNLVISGTPATGNSDSPVISPDGRFVAYRSSVTNAALGATNGLPQIFFYDRLTGATTLLTQSRFGNFAADNRSLSPVFSGNGQALLFESWANDLSSADFNYNADLFAFNLLYASITASMTAGQGPTLSWPATPQTSYRVQYKNNLSDPFWYDVGGSVTIVGDQGQLTDPAPAEGQRFYRIVAF